MTATVPQTKNPSTNFQSMKNFFTRQTFTAVLFAIGFSSAAALAQGSESWDQILEKASGASKPIVLEFTGSDWCPPCMMMNKEVFSTPEFKKFADNDIVFVKLDFPRKKELPADESERNNELAQQFRVEAFPTVVVLDAKGKELERNVGFMRGGPSAFISWVQNATE
jgi:thioredoxin-related protein